MRSIRRFLLAGVLLVVSLSLMLSSLVGYLDASHELEELFDARLAQSARITDRLLSDYLLHADTLPPAGTVYQDWHQGQSSPSDEEDDEATPFGHQYEGKLYFQLLDTSGRLLLRSPAAPAEPLTRPAPGFATIRHGDHHWRLFTLHDLDTDRWLLVAERDDVRGELASKLALRASLPPLLTLPLLLWLLWLLVSRGLRPLQQLTRAIGQRHPANLSPLTTADKVVELTPLTTELNRLMLALADTLEREKQFTNEAAHELKTPLTVLRIHIENALAAASPEQQTHSLHKALRALARSDRLVQQLLTQARLDNQQAAEQTPLSLHRLLRDTLAELAPLALEKQQQLSLSADIEAPYQGQPVLLGLLFSNLIDNAIRYTQHGGMIEVGLERLPGQYKVTISDNGPGIDEQQLPRVWERFFRANPQQGDGAGLGLAIVRRAAALHSARIELDRSPAGGLRARVYLPD